MNTMPAQLFQCSMIVNLRDCRCTNGIFFLVREVPSICRSIPLLAVASPSLKYGWKFGTLSRTSLSVKGLVSNLFAMTAWAVL